MQCIITEKQSNQIQLHSQLWGHKNKSYIKDRALLKYHSVCNKCCKQARTQHLNTILANITKRDSENITVGEKILLKGSIATCDLVQSWVNVQLW